MKRLTFEGNFCDICRCEGEYRMTSNCADGPCSQRKVWERLKEYEDIGLMPEEIINLINENRELRHYTYGPLHQKMGAWLQAEQEGRLLILDEQTVLAMAAGSYAIDINKRLRGATHMWDVLGIKGGPKTISYYDACLRLHEIANRVLESGGMAMENN